MLVIFVILKGLQGAMEIDHLDRKTAITDEERDNNPIYRVVFKKIRNLNKRLAQIEHIETL